MATPSRLGLELNELEWWSHWAQLRWLGKNAYALTSSEFPEPFFNRGGLITCRAIPSSLGKLENSFRRLGVKPVVAVYETCSSARKRLARTGYRFSDTMTVMISTGPSSPRVESAAEVIPASSADRWSRAYLLSFYGELGLLPKVSRVVRRVRRMDSTTLLQASLDGKVAGVLAIYRTSRLAGVYCVGTVPRFRRRGVAGALLAGAKEIASSERRSLFLQTLRSDGAEQYYVKRRFAALYRKVLMEKTD